MNFRFLEWHFSHDDPADSSGLPVVQIKGEPGIIQS